MKWLSWICGCCSAALSVSFAGDISKALLSGEIWEKNVSDSGVLIGVRFAEVDDNNIRIPRKGNFSVGNLEMGETLLSWNDEEVPTNMLIMIYNKGDDGAVERDEYMELMESSIDCLDNMFGVKGKVVKVSRRDSAVALKAWVWEWEMGVARLECAWTGGKRNFRGEFIRLSIGPDKASISKGSSEDAVKRSDLKQNLQRDEDSRRVYIENIPMVDQGSKGYCVPASVARVFAYYGMDGVDQHALAQICSSAGEDGTSTDTMKDALEAIGRKFHIRVQSLEGKSSTDAILKLIADYNKAAKKLKKQQATPMNWQEETTDAAVLLEARGNKKYTKKWLGKLKKYIDAGIPVLWCVELGIFPEEELQSQTSGSHMRLIIGYDEEKSQIIYSDSWGRGHEMKAMPLKFAASITREAYVLRPSR